VIVSESEIDLYRRHDAAAWFTGGGEPFEAVPGFPHLRQIRKRPDGACGFLSPGNLCRIHQELGAAKKPLSCRVFPYAFNPAPDAVVVTASFRCPTIVANEGTPIGAASSVAEIEALRRQWQDAHPSRTTRRELVQGRSIDARTMRVLRENLLLMLARDSDDIRDSIARIAAVLDDLTRSRVVALDDAAFAEYVSLTLPHAAARPDPPARRSPGGIGRLMQYGFLFVVAATREAIERSQPRSGLRLRRLRMLAHFHGLAPRVGRVNVRAIRRHAIDINAPEFRPIVTHYLRAHLQTLGARARPVLDDLAVAVSCLNAAIALAAMNAGSAGRAVDRQLLIDAVSEAAALGHASGNALLDAALKRFAAGTASLWKLADASPRR
jgi:hypothetical protein